MSICEGEIVLGKITLRFLWGKIAFGRWVDWA